MWTLERLRSRVQAHVHFQASLRRKGVAADVTAEELLTCKQPRVAIMCPPLSAPSPRPKCPRVPLCPAGCCGRAGGLLGHGNASSAHVYTRRSVFPPHLACAVLEQCTTEAGVELSEGQCDNASALGTATSLTHVSSLHFLFCRGGTQDASTGRSCLEARAPGSQTHCSSTTGQLLGHRFSPKSPATNMALPWGVSGAEHIPRNQHCL